MEQTIDQPTSADTPGTTGPDGDAGGAPPAAEPAPAPAPERPVAQAPPRPARRVARRARVVLRKVGPLSVLKFSLIFYFCVMLIVYLALVIIWLVLSAVGGVDSLSKILGDIFGTGQASTSGREPVTIDGRLLFTWLFIAGAASAVVWSFITVFVVFLYNLISDLVGGVEVTLAEKPQR